MYTISMPRGDIRPVRFTIEYADEDQEDIEFDEIYFTVKSSFSQANYLFQKRLTQGTIEKLEDGSYQFSIMPADTDGLRFGKYVFDIEVVAGDEIKQTFVGTLELTNEVTYAENEG